MRSTDSRNDYNGINLSYFQQKVKGFNKKALPRNQNTLKAFLLSGPSGETCSKSKTSRESRAPSMGINFSFTALLPFLSPLYLAGFGILVIKAYGKYLSADLDIIVVVTFGMLISATYALDRFMDYAGKCLGNADSVILRNRHHIFLGIAVVTALSSILILLAAGMFRIVHIAIIMTGVLYCLPLIPVGGDRNGLVFSNAKSIPYGKSVVVTTSWSLLPLIVILSTVSVVVTSVLALCVVVCTGMAADLASNLFCDILDKEEDGHEGVRSAVVIHGRKKIYPFCGIFNSTLFVGVFLLALFGQVAWSFVPFCLLNAVVYPVIYMGLYNSFQQISTSKSTTAWKIAADGYLPVFALWLFLL